MFAALTLPPPSRGTQEITKHLHPPTSTYIHLEMHRLDFAEMRWHPSPLLPGARELVTKMCFVLHPRDYRDALHLHLPREIIYVTARGTKEMASR